MSSLRPQSSRGRGRGRHGSPGVNTNVTAREPTRDHSPKDNQSPAAGGGNRHRQKKPEVQRYVPRGRRLLNQQDEEAKVEQVGNCGSSNLSGKGDNSPIRNEDQQKDVKKRTKNEVYIPPGRRAVKEPENQESESDTKKEGSQFEDADVNAILTSESSDQKFTDDSHHEIKELSPANRTIDNIVLVGNERIHNSESIPQDNVDKACVGLLNDCDKMEGTVDLNEEDKIDVDSNHGDHMECEDSLNENETEKEKVVEDTSESERTSVQPKELLKETVEAIKTEDQEVNMEDTDDIPLNWDDDVEESNEAEERDLAEGRKQKSGKASEESVKQEVKGQVNQASEAKSESKKIKLKKMKKKSKVSNESKAEEETLSVEKKGKKKSSRSNISVFDMMNMHELQEEKKEDMKVETKVEVVPEVDPQEDTPKGDNSDEEGDSWDKMFDDDGECLDSNSIDELTKTVGKVKIEKATINYLDFSPKEPDFDEMNHVIEIYDFPAEFKTGDLLSIFSQFNKGFDIKWVDDTHALGVFSSAIAAQNALKLVHPLCKFGPLSEASKACKAKAKCSVEFLQPYKPRPETTAMTARRLVTGALGIAPKVSKEQRELERKRLKEAKEKKRNDRKQREDIWEGTISSNSSS
ncbi:uncharacterized protein LOC125659708 isoform X2 [Ostrea edulis]|uniref:uncharacterized protein LOC125659708 isoform X2 n=1 Tax=Ostrea edulis TaxID=37623 RepID=UPI0024AEF9B1|nr:uncharacterized protein LOC125659708 isoform X2 [Ostrea edulis]